MLDTIRLVQDHRKTDSLSENDFFNGVNDLFIGETRSINKKYLGCKKTKKGFSENISTGFLYLLNARGTDLYKIGITSNMNRRFRDISSCSPLPILLCCNILIKDPSVKEDFLHKYYENKYFKNDWFELDIDQFKECVCFFKQWQHGS